MDVKKLLIGLIALSSIGCVFASQPSISLTTSTQPPNSPMIQHSLSFLFPLAYQAGPFQEIKICGKISNSASSSVQATLDVYTRLEGDTNLLTSKEIEYDYTMMGVAGHGGPYKVSGDRYPSTGYTTFVLSPGDYVSICWILKTGNINKDGKIRAYFYAKDTQFNIEKTAYSDWVYLKPKPPEISGWNVNVYLYGGAAILALLALLKIKGII